MRVQEKEDRPQLSPHLRQPLFNTVAVINELLYTRFNQATPLNISLIVDDPMPRRPNQHLVRSGVLPHV